VALASYVVDAIENGRVLIVDELDSSLHFTLTRAIVSLFNNEINLDGQLIFTAHDVSLLDCKKLFRKEQIWFIYRDRDNIHTYSLKEFTAREPKGPSLCLKSGTGGRSKCLISQS
jgi:AAA15 family ATPase/GTPase